MERYTENWVEVDVTIDDVAFEFDGEDVESDSNNNRRTIYKFHMDRILHYTYNGVDYDVKDERTYESENPDYSVEPRQNYKDEYVYKINPSDPASMSISYTIGGGEGIFAVFDKIIILDWSFLINTKFFDMCDNKILLDFPNVIRKERAMLRDSISSDKFDLREKNCLDYDIDLFDYVIKDNDKDEFKRMVKKL